MNTNILYEHEDRKDIESKFNTLLKTNYDQYNEYCRIPVIEFINQNPTKNIQSLIPERDNHFKKMVLFALFKNKKNVASQVSADLIYYIRNEHEILPILEETYEQWIISKFDYNCRHCTAGSNYIYENTTMIEVNHRKKTYICSFCQKNQSHLISANGKFKRKFKRKKGTNPQVRLNKEEKEFIEKRRYYQAFDIFRCKQCFHIITKEQITNHSDTSFCLYTIDVHQKQRFSLSKIKGPEIVVSISDYIKYVYS